MLSHDTIYMMFFSKHYGQGGSLKFPTIFIIFFSLSFNSFARKPAVEPIMGVSIEEYKEVPPEKTKGYDFNERKPNAKSVESVPRKHSTKELNVQSANEPKETINLVIVFFILLPIVATALTYFNFQNTVRKREEAASFDNVESLDKKSNDDDFNFPKAS